MNRVTLQTITLGSALAFTGLLGAQTPAPVTPKTSTASPTSAGPVNSGIAAPVDPNKVVLSIDGDNMTAAQFDNMIKAFPPQVQAAAKGPQRHTFIEQYVQLIVAAKEAERLNLQAKPEVKQQISIQRDNVLAGALYQDMLANVKVSDADVQKYYDDHKNEFETAKAHHVLIRFKGSPVPLGKDKKELTEDEALAKAKEVQKRLLAGEDFAKVATAESDDTSSQGGDLNEFKHGQMVGEFDKAVFSLPVGKISDPIKTQFGYHIIRVDSRTTKTLAEVKPDIEKKLRPELAKKEMDDLKVKEKVVIDEAFFTPPPGSGPVMPAGPAK